MHTSDHTQLLLAWCTGVCCLAVATTMLLECTSRGVTGLKCVDISSIVQKGVMRLPAPSG